jgi:hypothetical protein
MEKTIKELKKLFRSLKSDGGEKCVYCGLLATDKDYFADVVRYNLENKKNIRLHTFKRALDEHFKTW